MEEIPGNSSTTAVITGTGTYTSALETAGDVDWWRLNLVAGRTYQFTLSGDGSATSLDDAQFVIRDSLGTSITYDSTFSGGPLVLNVTAAATGPYYLSVSDNTSSDNPAAEGSYVITTRMDDYLPNDNSTTAVIANGTTAGSLEANGDADRFRVHLKAGQNVDFTLNGDGGPNSLDDAYIYLVDQNGNTITYNYTYSGGPIRIAAQAGYTGNYYVVVSDKSPSDRAAEGNYIVTAHLTDTVFGNSTTTAMLRDGSTYFGQIDAVGDKDWVRFAAVTGITYSFTLSGSGAANALAAKEMVLRDALGNAINYDRDYGSGAVTVTWTATSTGPVFLDLHGISSSVGDYRLSVVSTAPVVTGTAGNDDLSGGANNNLVQGLAGNDRLFGGAGNDTLIGGAGNDTLIGGAGIDLVSFAGVSTGARANLALTGPQVTGEGLDVLTGIENLIGGAGADVFIGSAGANVLVGGAGADTLAAGAGADTLYGGLGNDRLIGAAGIDTVVFQTTNAVVVNLTAGTATGEGSDQLVGIERVYTGAGNDVIIGDSADNFLFGMAGADTLLAGSGNDVLAGGTMNDTLSGGLGNDTLLGQAGQDFLRGGAGADQFYRGRGEGLDHILDWQDGIDRMRIGGATGFAQLKIVQAGANVYVQFQGETAMVIHDQVVSHITAADFIF